jgi:serine/threonine protein kinase
MDLLHLCGKIANAPRRVHMTRCKFMYQENSYEVLVDKIISHNYIKICFAVLYINNRFSKRVVIKTYEPLSFRSTRTSGTKRTSGALDYSPEEFDPDLYSGLIDEIEIHTIIESKIGYSKYYSHMLFHYWTDKSIGIIYDDFGDTLCKTNMSMYSLGAKKKMLLQLINQINFLQQNEIYHGDLKPANICVTSNGDIVLIDFGIGYFKEFYCDTKLKTKYNTTITSGSPEYISIYLGYSAGKEYPKELFDKSQHFAIGGLIFGILVGNPELYFSKCYKIINLLKKSNEDLENLNPANRFKYFNEEFSKTICDFISKEFESKPELHSFKPIILNMFEYDYNKRLDLEEIINQIQKIDELS